MPPAPQPAQPQYQQPHYQQAPPQGQAYGQQQYAPPPNAQPQSAGMEENVAAALCYLVGWITGVLFLVLEPYNKNRTIRFHAFQSIFFNVAAVAAFIGVWIVSFVLVFVPYVGFIITMLLDFGIGLGIFIVWIMLLYKAYNNERWVLPVIGPLAEKQA